MDYWKGPHSKIIAASPGMLEYRQIHLDANNPGRWPARAGIETSIPEDRKVDGVADVTFQSALSPVRGLKQTRMAFADEVNVFRRTLLYAGPPRSSRWYDVGDPDRVGARALIYLRRGDTVGARAFRRHVSESLVPTLAASSVVGELRTQSFMPWSQRTWNTPNVAHDNPPDARFHASLMLGFRDGEARAAFFADPATERISDSIAPFVSAIHA